MAITNIFHRARGVPYYRSLLYMQNSLQWRD